MTTLPTLPLGTTGMDVTRVGFGAWAIGGADWYYSLGPQDDQRSIATIRHAVEAGVNWIDTAAVYGLGHSERLVARALEGLPEPDRPYVFTKGGLVWDPADRRRRPERVGDPASLRGELEDSLRRLDVERIDLYQMHWPARDGTSLDDYWQALLDLVAQGKVRAVGLSNHDVDAHARAETLGHVDSSQPLFNAIRREAAADLLPWCAGNGTGVIVYSPMASGLLSGSYDHARVAALGDDWRRNDLEFQEPHLSPNLALVDTLRRVADRHGATVGAVAVAWTLCFTGVTGAIVGARTPDQVDGWVSAGSLHLDDADLDEIARAIDGGAVGGGPSRP